MANEVRDELDVHKCMNCHLVIHGLEGFISHSKTCTWKNYNCSYTLENPPYLRPLGMPSPAVSYRSSPTLTCSSSDDGDFEKINEDLRHYYTSLVTEEEEDCLKENEKTESIVGSVTDGTKESLALGVDEGNGNGSMLLECSQNNATSLPSNLCRELGHVDIFAGSIEDADEERMPQLVDENRSLNIGHLGMEGDQKDVSYQETVVNIEWEFKTLKQVRGRSERRRDRCRGPKGTSCTSETQEKCFDEVGNGEYSENGPVAVKVVESKVKKNSVRSREKCWKRACPTDIELRNAENIVESKVSKQSGYLHAEGGEDSLVNPVDTSVRDRVVEKCVVNFPSGEKQKISGSDKFCQSMTKNTVGGSKSGVNSLRKKRDYSASRVGEVNCSTLVLETEQSFSKISRGTENFGADKSVCGSDSSSGKVEEQEMAGAPTEFRETKIANFENKSDNSLSHGSERTLDGTTAVETSDEIDCRDQFCRVLETMNSIHSSLSGENEQTPSPTKSVSVANEPDGHSPPCNKQKHNADSGEMQQAAGESPSNAENLVCDGLPFSMKVRVDSEGAQMGVICARSATQTSTPKKKFFMQSLELNPKVPPKRANVAPSGISSGDESSQKASGFKETYVTISVVKKSAESKDGERIGSAEGSRLSSGVPLISPPREEGRTVALSEFISSCKNLPSWREYRDRGSRSISEVRGLESPETLHNLSSSSGSSAGAADSDPEVTEMSAITESMCISNGGHQGGEPHRELPSAGIINAGMDWGSDGGSKAYRRRWGGKRRTVVVRRSSKKQSASDENELDFMSKKALIEKLCPMLEDKSMDIYIDHNYFCLFPAALIEPTSSEAGQNVESIIKGAVNRVSERAKELNEVNVRRRKDEKSNDRRRKSVHRSNTVRSDSNDADAAVNIPGDLDENVGNSSPNEISNASRRKSRHRIRRDISSNDAHVAVNIPGDLDEDVGNSSPNEISNASRRKSRHRIRRDISSNDAHVAVNIPGDLDEDVGNSSPNEISNASRRKSRHRIRRDISSNDAHVAVNIPGDLDENVGNSSPNEISNASRRKSPHRIRRDISSNDAHVAVNIPGDLDENVGNSSPNEISNASRRKSPHRIRRDISSNDAHVAVNIPGDLDEDVGNSSPNEISNASRRKSRHRIRRDISSNDAHVAVNIPGDLDENVGNSSPNEISNASRRKSPHRIRRDISSNDAHVAENIPGDLDENVGNSFPNEKSKNRRRKSLHRSKTRVSHSNDAHVAVNIPGDLDEDVGNSSPNEISNASRRKSPHRIRRDISSNDAHVAVNIPGDLDEDVGNSSPNEISNASRRKSPHRIRRDISSNDAHVAVNIPGDLDENVGNSSPNEISNASRRKSRHRIRRDISSNDAHVAVNIPGDLDENVGNSSPNEKSNSQRRKSPHRSKTRRSHSKDADVAVNIPGDLDENVGNSSPNEKSNSQRRKSPHRSKTRRSHSKDADVAVNIPGDLDENVGNSSPNEKSNSQRRKSPHRSKTRRSHSNDADVAVNIPGDLDENVGNSSPNEKSKNRRRKSLHRSKNKRSHSNDAYGAVNIPGVLDKNVGDPSSNECLDRNGNVGQSIERSKVVPAGRELAVPEKSFALSDNASSSSTSEISLTSDVSKLSVHKAETCGKRNSPAKDLSDNVVTRGVGAGTSECVNESGALGEFPTSQFVLEDIRSLSKETWAKMDLYKPGNCRKQGIYANPIDEEGHAVTNWPVTTFEEKKRSAHMRTLPKSPLAKCSKKAPDISSGSRSLSVLNATKEISARSSDKKITKMSSRRNIKKRKRDLKRSLKKTGEKCLKEITGKPQCDQTKLFMRVTVDLGVRCDSNEFKRQQLRQHALTPMTSSGRKTGSSLERENEQLTIDSVSKPSTVDEVGHCHGDGNRSDIDGIISVDIFNNLKLLKPVFSKLGNCIDLAPAHNGGVLQSLVIHPMRKLEQQKSRMTQMVRVDYNKFDGNRKCQCSCRRRKELVRHSDVHHLFDESQDAGTIDHPWECYLDPSKCVCKCDVNVRENPVGPSGSETGISRNMELLPTESLEFSFSDRLVRSLLQNNLIGQPSSVSRNSPLINGSTSSKTSLDKASSERSKIISRKERRAPSLEMSGLPNETLLNSSINSFDDPPKLSRRSQRLRKSVDRLTYFRELTVKRRMRFRGHKVGEHTPFDYDSESESSTSVTLKKPSGTRRFRRHRKSAKKLSTHNDGYVTDYYYSCSEETMEKIDFPLKKATSIGSDLDVLEKEGEGGDGSTCWEFGSTENTVPENRKMPLRSCKSISALNSYYSEKYLCSY